MNEEQRTLGFDIALLVTLGGAFIYTCGWAFAYDYFGLFHLGLLSLDIPAEYFFVYGFWVLRDHWWLWGFYLVLAVLWFVFRMQIYSGLKRWGMLLFSLVPLLILVLFLLGTVLATHTAEAKYMQQQARDFPSYPSVRIWLKKTESSDPKLVRLEEKLPEGCYRLLLENQGKVFVFRPKKGEIVDLSVLEIPQSEVNVMRVLPRYWSCD